MSLAAFSRCSAISCRRRTPKVTCWSEDALGDLLEEDAQGWFFVSVFYLLARVLEECVSVCVSFSRSVFVVIFGK